VPQVKILAPELQMFRVKQTWADNESFEAWPERGHYDVVLATATSAWAAENIEWPQPAIMGGWVCALFGVRLT
jgi:hypothetical protein